MKNEAVIGSALRTITIPATFREIDWQQAFLVPRSRDLRGAALSVSFSACVWADPLPLLYLAMNLRRMKASGTSLKTIELGDIDDAQHGQFLSFALQHGFLGRLAEVFDELNWTQSTKPYSGDIAAFRTAFDIRRYPLAFEDSESLRATILSPNDPAVDEQQLPNTVKGWVAEIFDRRALTVSWSRKIGQGVKVYSAG